MNASTVDELRGYAYLDKPGQTLLDNSERPSLTAEFSGED